MWERRSDKVVVASWTRIAVMVGDQLEAGDESVIDDQVDDICSCSAQLDIEVGIRREVTMDEVEMGCERGGVGTDWVPREWCSNWALRGVEEGGGGWDTPLVAVGMWVVEARVADGPAVEVEIEAVEVGLADGPAVEVEAEEVEVGVGVRRGGQGGRLEPDMEGGFVVVTTWIKGVNVSAMLSIRLERLEMGVAKEDWRARKVSCMDCNMVNREMLVGVS
ncbi:hypothetical protein CBR_g37888 [Chara braunii]|uniref:Uncharacterized protein n=1 Tax=Chara braunii TaxID=69332 RepID=A0A388LNY5_CHABU|nr:hypothetical protein CBR_g37888 [Chara braunii]|eukprot:GBG84014.1 hypothetical protein CBR_g37888 [Chara braunii]